MGRLPGSTFMPTVEREGMPISSPNSSPSSFVAPFATAVCLQNFCIFRHLQIFPNFRNAVVSYQNIA